MEKCLFRSSVHFFFLNYLFIYGCVGSSFLCEGFLHLRQVGATLHRGAWASHYRSLSCCGAQAPDVQAQQLWLMGLVALWHVGSSQTRARTHVPCIGRQILNHCATREALFTFLIGAFVFLILNCMSCLYTLDINRLLVTSFANIFSHCVGCLFLSLLCKSF